MFFLIIIKRKKKTRKENKKHLKQKVPAKGIPNVDEGVACGRCTMCGDEESCWRCRSLAMSATEATGVLVPIGGLADMSLTMEEGVEGCERVTILPAMYTANKHTPMVNHKTRVVPRSESARVQSSIEHKSK